MKKHLKILASYLTAAMSFSMFSGAHAGLLNVDGTPTPNIVAGDGSVTPDAPVVPAGLFGGVTSIYIETDAGGFICTGSAISKRHIVTAAHCIDSASDVGQVIDITQPGFRVRTVFTDGGVLNAIIDSEALNIHPDYHGFAKCEAGEFGGLSGACLNDDIAVITLSEDIPDGIEIYDFVRDPSVITHGTLFTMVGHGTTGNGLTGSIPNSSDFFTKRIGFNFAEIFDCDESTGGSYLGPIGCDLEEGSQAEVWWADYDGIIPDVNGDINIDVLCTLFTIGCGNGLGDDFADLFEAGIAGGDSGGPSFIYDAVQGKFLLAANNTFGNGSFATVPNGYGNLFGGNLYAPYLDWIDTNFLLPLAARDVPAPAVLGLLMMGLSLVAMRRYKRTA